MAPGSIFHHISFRSTILQSFTFRSINQKTQKYLLYRLFSFIYLYRISLLQVTVKGLTTPLSHWVQVVWLFVQVLVICALSPTGLIPWFSKLREILISTLLHHPFLFKGKNNTSSRSCRKNFWHCCQGDLCQVKTYQVPIINSYLLHLHYSQFSSCFPLPHF